MDSYAVTSDGETIANPRHYKKLAERLEREQRTLSRKTKGSNNRRKAAPQGGPHLRQNHGHAP